MPKIVVIGCGYWGENHIKTLKNIGVLAGISDIKSEKAKELAEKYQTKFYPLATVFEDKGIDAMVLALPPETHVDYAIKAMQHGKDVFVEKPLALDIFSAQKAIDVAKVENKILMVGHILRFHAAFEKIVSLFEENVIGSLRYVYAHRLGFGRFHKKSDALWDLAPHDLSLILALTKKNPTEVQNIESGVLHAVADFAHLHMIFDENLKGHVFVSRLNPFPERKLVLIGDKATLVFDDLKNWDEKVAYSDYKIDETTDPIDFSLGKIDYYPVEPSMPLTEELKHFLACIETRKNPKTDGQEALNILKILTTKNSNF